jgi:hypothetical protein
VGSPDLEQAAARGPRTWYAADRRRRARDCDPQQRRLARKAITDGQLSPYERNVSGWLELAGGLGGILHDANGQIGKILDPSQPRAMSDAGFEWGKYLGVKARGRSSLRRLRAPRVDYGRPAPGYRLARRYFSNPRTLA